MKLLQKTTMGKKPKKVLILTVVVVISLFLGTSTYLKYYGLLEADILASNLSFENPDLENLFADHKNQMNLIPPSASDNTQTGNISENHFYCFLPKPSLDRKNPVLRC
jgi:hypothetical protein